MKQRGQVTLISAGFTAAACNLYLDDIDRHGDHPDDIGDVGNIAGFGII